MCVYAYSYVTVTEHLAVLGTFIRSSFVTLHAITPTSVRCQVNLFFVSNFSCLPSLHEHIFAIMVFAIMDGCLLSVDIRAREIVGFAGSGPIFES